MPISEAGWGPSEATFKANPYMVPSITNTPTEELS